MTSEIIVIEEGVIPVGFFVVLVVCLVVVPVKPFCEIGFSVLGMFLVEGSAFHVVEFLVEVVLLGGLEFFEVLGNVDDVTVVRLPLIQLYSRYL